MNFDSFACLIAQICALRKIASLNQRSGLM